MVEPNSTRRSSLHARHMNMCMHIAAMVEPNVDKVFLDWWLLARSAGTITLGSSAFVTSAINFKAATQCHAVAM